MLLEGHMMKSFITALLANNGVDVNSLAYLPSHNQSGRTALMWAAEGGHQEVCAWLADRGADPNATDRVYWSNELLRIIH